MIKSIWLLIMICKGPQASGDGATRPIQETIEMVQEAIEGMEIPAEEPAPSPWLPLDDSIEVSFVSLSGNRRQTSDTLDEACKARDESSEVFHMYSYPNIIPFLEGTLPELQRNIPSMQSPWLLNVKVKETSEELETGICHQVSIPPGEGQTETTVKGRCSRARVLCSKRRVWKSSRVATVIRNLSTGALGKLRALAEKWRDIAGSDGPDLRTFMKGVREKAWKSEVTSAIIPDIVDTMTDMLMTKAIDNLRERSSRFGVRLGAIENRTSAYPAYPSHLESRVTILENKMKTEPTRLEERIFTVEDKLDKGLARWEPRILTLETKINNEPARLDGRIRISADRLKERIKVVENWMRAEAHRAQSNRNNPSHTELPSSEELETTLRAWESRIVLLEMEMNKFHTISEETSELIDQIFPPQLKEAESTSDGSGFSHEDPEEERRSDMQTWQTLCNSLTRCLNLTNLEISRVKRSQEEELDNNNEMSRHDPGTTEESISRNGAQPMPNRDPKENPASRADNQRTDNSKRSHISQIYDEITKSFFTPMSNCLPCWFIMASLVTLAGTGFLQAVCICFLCLRVRRTSRLTKRTCLRLEERKKGETRSSTPPKKADDPRVGALKKTTQYRMLPSEDTKH